MPIRLELGPKDMEKEAVMLARRDTGEKESVSWSDLTTRIPELLEQIQVNNTCISWERCRNMSACAVKDLLC